VVMSIAQSQLPVLLIAYANLLVPSGLIATLISMTPLFTLIFKRVFFNNTKTAKKDYPESVDRIVVVGIVVGLLGAALVCLPQIIVQSQQNTPVTGAVGGIVMAAGAAVSWACAGIFNDQYLKTYHPTIKSWYAQGFGCILTYIVAFAVEYSTGTMRFGMNPSGWFWMLFLGMLVSYLSVFLNYFLLDTIGPVLTSSVWYLVPFIGLFVGVIFQHEWSGYLVDYIVMQCLGCVVIVLGLVLSVFPNLYRWILEKKERICGDPSMEPLLERNNIGE